MSRSGEPSTKARTLKRRLGRWPKRVWIVGAGVGVLVLVVVVYLVVNNQPVLDKHLATKADFPVYAPKVVPSGYNLDATKTQLSDQSLTYTFTSTAAAKDIVVTVQPLPKNFDMSKLVGSGSVNSTTTDNGVLYNLSAAGNSQYLLNTGDALIFFTSTGTIDTATINSLVSDLARQN